MTATLRSVSILARDDLGRTFLQMRDGAARASPLLWSLWGGAIDEGDPGPLACAARELAEELGIEARESDFMLVGRRQSSTQIALLVQYVPAVQWGSVRIREGAGAGFFWREEIARIPMSPSLGYYLQAYASLFAARPATRQP